MTGVALLFLLVWLSGSEGVAAQAPVRQQLTLEARGAGAPSFSGVYPHLASFNRQNECGTGAVVPWAGKLWWLTYAPHRPDGSDDKLYATNPSLDLFSFPGSVGGTPANRMIHRETQQLLIGSYVIDAQGKIRVIPPKAMRGRLTGTARHLTEPATKVYYATMEEGLYEVDVRTLAVTRIFADGHDTDDSSGALLPGYHGKGLYTGFGRVFYANNGEKSRLAQTRPDIASGVLASWAGEGSWQAIRRNQFTDVTGPGGIHGNPNPDRDPIWSIGWDHRSLILMLRNKGGWQAFRLPKASHCYDGAHGWNTEWPRIRAIGERDLLMTMHGTFWRFPARFDAGATAGIRPRSSYLKVIGDFCRYGDRLVFGCDDAAKSEFLNRRRAKGKVAGPAASQSNLWFVPPGRLDALGPRLGRGGVWVDEPVVAGQPSDRYLFAGYPRRGVHLRHDAGKPVSFRFETDAGDGTWKPLRVVAVPATGYAWVSFAAEAPGDWIRVTANVACTATAWFEFNEAPRSTDPGLFRSLRRVGAKGLGGLLRAGSRKQGLQVLATDAAGRPSGYFELRPDLAMVRVADARRQKWMESEVAFPRGVVRIDGDSVLYVDDAGTRFRLPVGNPAYLQNPQLLDAQRAAREVVTERDLFQCAGTFFELPARNAGGFAKIRPIATHDGFVEDFCSWRGLMALTGICPEGDDPRVVRSADGRAAVWLGTIDDLWELGKVRGHGGPWRRTKIRGGVPSDPYLMAGYDRKAVRLSHEGRLPRRFTLEVDITGTGHWCAYRAFEVPPGEDVSHRFPPGFAAYWIRVTADADCVATATLTYE